VVADGNGGLAVQFGTENPLNVNRHILEGIRRHEQTHIRDLLDKNPNAGAGVAAGQVVTFTNERDLWASEVNASQTEIDFLLNILDTERLTDAERQEIQARIDQMRDYRNGFQDRLNGRNPP